MNKLIKNILSKIENHGFEAYIIGGYVRDLLVGKSSFDIDICTNATPKELIKIFPQSSTKNLGGIEFKIREYHFEITTYREEIKYKNRKPIEYNYINNLVEDLKRRDFTINAICMNTKGEIIDLIDGTKDLANLKIKMIGDIKTKIKEDPLRILRAIRIATHLNFSLDSELYKELKKEYKRVLKLSNTRIKEELDKILLSENPKKGLKLLEELGISKLLGLTYNEITNVKNLEAMYAQIDIKYNLPFTKVERENIKIIKSILKKGDINKSTLYKHGLFLTTVAGEILNINKKTINKMYKELPIKVRKDLNVTPDEIVKILNIEYSSKVGKILNDLENLIISGKIKNKKKDIIKYLIETKK
ncbi:MAG: CCA tRNA nucleotidyltransferase [Bacilli bacterium]|nr:CCA tRNA nucleotidyltransferase [Bacilli bacterium]